MRKNVILTFLISFFGIVPNIKADIFDDIHNFGNSVVTDSGIDYIGLDGNIKTSNTAHEMISNVSYPINLLVKLKRIIYDNNIITFDFFIQNKEPYEFFFKISPESIGIFNVEGDKLIPKMDSLEFSITKDLEYFSVIVEEDSDIKDSYKILLPIEFKSKNINGILNFFFKDITIK